jgi:hypothetical protein
MRRNNSDKEMCQDYFKYAPILKPSIGTLNISAGLAPLPFATSLRFLKSGMVLTEHLCK